MILYSRDLLSKWGFNDSATPGEWRDYLNPPDAPRLDVTPFPLIQVVRRYMLPVLDQEVEVEEIETSHNPIRARSVDGLNVEHLWSGEHSLTDGQDSRGILTPKSVEVPLHLIKLLLPFEGEIITDALSMTPSRPAD